jgi:beta-phosphoglucomutase-like phosphatase (HAD superfamily)
MTATPLRALIFDVDGTLADSENAHLAAFNSAFAETGIGWHWDAKQYTRLLEISGGKERLMHYWGEVHGGIQALDATAVADTIQRIHDLKTAGYERMVLDGAVHLRPGVLELIRSAFNEGLRLAIATTTSPVNIDALLRSAMGPDWIYTFKVVEDASTARRKKPYPQVYLQTLERLQLPATECLAFEDSANGLASAMGAKLKTIVTPNEFTAHQDFTGALRVLANLQGTTVSDLRQWHAEAAH